MTPRTLFTVTAIVLALPNIALSITEPMTPLARTVNVLLPISVYLLLMSCIKNPAKTVWAMFPLIFFAAFQIVLLYIFGGSIIAVDMFLNVVTTNPGEVSELLGSLIPALVIVAVLYLPVLYFGARYAGRKGYTLDGHFRLTARRSALTGACVGAIILAACYATSDYRAEDDLYPANVCYNLGLAVDRSWRTAHYAETSAGFNFNAISGHPAGQKEVYVLVIGETARARNFGIYGYSRNTTPHLASTSGLITFPRAFTQSNTTHKSVPMLLSAASAEDYNRIYSERGIITAFREAGFHTAFISNQRPNHSFIDIFGREADQCKFLKDGLPEGANVYDGKMLEMVDEIISKGHDRQLIVLHTYGSHFKYADRYPHEIAQFTPDRAFEATPQNRQALVNAYDNTILYTDLLLHTLISRLQDTGIAAAMLYTSDHGENIFDDSRDLFLHASPRPSAYELHVPLIVWLSDSYRQSFPDTGIALQNHSNMQAVTSTSVFHTMLDIAGIDTPIKADSLSLASPNYKPQPYNYLSDRNIPIPVLDIMRPRP